MKLTTNDKVLITKEEIVLIKNLTIDYNRFRFEMDDFFYIDEEYKEISIHVLYDILDALDEKVKTTEQYIPSEINKRLEDTFKMKIDEYRTLIPYDLLEMDAINKVTQVLKVASEIVSISNTLHKLDDYSQYMNDVISSLSYFCNEELVNTIKKEYKEALDRADIEKLKKVVDSAQEMILNHWQEYVTDVDTYNGENYKFICHSTNSTKFDGDFFTNYVSCSLLTEELTDTYRSGFGFIMSPEDIVAASYKDMYVINSAESEEDLFYYTSVIKLDGPEKIENEALKLKSENNESNNERNVYTEVVLQGFHPKAIFCLTDGSKMIDYNYSSAFKLRESYPDLKVIVLDITKNKTDKELKSIKKNLIERIRLYLKLPETISDNYYENFDLFWTQYQELISQDNYTEDDIIKLFKYHDELLSIFLDEKTLFETYDSKTIKHILYYNYKFRIIDILNNNYDVLVLDRLCTKLSVYKNDKRLDEIVPGITYFLRLYPNIVLSEDEQYKICTYNNFTDINNFLLNILHTNKMNSTFEADDTLDRFFNDDINITNLIELYNKVNLLDKEGRIDYTRNDICLFLKLFPSVKPDATMLEDLRTKDIHTLDQLNDILLDNLSRKKLTLESKINQCESKILAHETQLEKRTREKEKYQMALLCKNCEYDYAVAKKDYSDIKEEINNLLRKIKNIENQINAKAALLDVTTIDIDSLNKHRIINKRKINSLLQSKQSLSDDIETLKIEIRNLNTELIRLKTELRIVADNFKHKTGFNLHDYESVLLDSNIFLSSFSIDRINEDINTLQRAIAKLKSLLFNYNGKKRTNRGIRRREEDMISISILNIKDDNEKIEKVDELKADYIHMDVMDGQFVSNTTDLLDIKKTNTKRDVHLMVYDVKEYVDRYLKFEPEFITFHYEAIDNIDEMIDYIKSKNVKVGLSIKPDTSVESIKKYLDKLDLVLIMSVEPGKGGQSFIESSTDKIDLLAQLRKEYHYHYLIEVDGGVKDTTKEYCSNADILVVGSFITMSDNYEERYNQVKDN